MFRFAAKQTSFTLLSATLSGRDLSLLSEGLIMRHEITDHEWITISPMLPALMGLCPNFDEKADRVACSSQAQPRQLHVRVAFVIAQSQDRD